MSSSKNIDKAAAKDDQFERVAKCIGCDESEEALDRVFDRLDVTTTNPPEKAKSDHDK